MLIKSTLLSTALFGFNPGAASHVEEATSSSIASPIGLVANPLSRAITSFELAGPRYWSFPVGIIPLPEFLKSTDEVSAAQLPKKIAEDNNFPVNKNLLLDLSMLILLGLGLGKAAQSVREISQGTTMKDSVHTILPCISFLLLAAGIATTRTLSLTLHDSSLGLATAFTFPLSTGLLMFIQRYCLMKMDRAQNRNDQLLEQHVISFIKLEKCFLLSGVVMLAHISFQWLDDPYDLELYQVADDSYRLDVSMDLYFSFQDENPRFWSEAQEQDYKSQWEQAIRNSWGNQVITLDDGSTVTLNFKFDDLTPTERLFLDHWDIKVNLEDTWSRVSPLLRQSQLWTLDPVCNNNDKSQCVAAHEFGHMLGYIHDEYEEDSPYYSDSSSVMHGGNEIRLRHLSDLKEWVEEQI